MSHNIAKKNLQQNFIICKITTQIRDLFLLKERLKVIPFLHNKFLYEAKDNSVILHEDFDEDQVNALEFILSHAKIYSNAMHPADLQYVKSEIVYIADKQDGTKHISHMTLREVDSVRRLADYLLYAPLTTYMAFRPKKTTLHIQCGRSHRDKKLFYTLTSPTQYIRMRLKEIHHKHYYNDFVCSISFDQNPVIQLSEFTEIQTAGIFDDQELLEELYLSKLPNDFGDKTGFEIVSLINRNLSKFFTDLGYGLTSYHIERLEANNFHYIMYLDAEIDGVLQVSYNLYRRIAYGAYKTMQIDNAIKSPRALILDHYYSLRTINYDKEPTVLIFE